VGLDPPGQSPRSDSPGEHGPKSTVGAIGAIVYGHDFTRFGTDDLADRAITIDTYASRYGWLPDEIDSLDCNLVQALSKVIEFRFRREETEVKSARQSR
jgi:hypothetical protein